MTPGQFFAFCALAETRWRAEQAAALAQMATAFRAEGKFIESSMRRLLEQ
jgi:hypothetical protein